MLNKFKTREHIRVAPVPEAASVTPGSSNLQSIASAKTASPSFVSTANEILLPMSFPSFRHSYHRVDNDFGNSSNELQQYHYAKKITSLQTPAFPRLSLFDTLPFQLNHRDQGLLFHCKPPILNSEPYFCAKCCAVQDSSVLS
jgi:hypothetical protein